MMRLPVIGLALMAIPPAALNAAPDPFGPVVRNATSENRSATLWRASCGFCHNRENFAPDLLGHHIPIALTVATVRNGASGMPPFHASEISDSDLAALAEWIARSALPTDLP